MLPLTFAIAIPNFNQSHFLPTALECLHHQNASLEIAVMDGGSSDNINSVLKQYSEIISFSRSKPDRGQSDAIREAAEKTSGDILTWLNADDYYFPGILEKVRSVFENNPKVDIVYGDAIYVNPDGIFLSYFPPVRGFDKKNLTRNNFICQPACFYRRKIYEKVGGIDPNLHYTMDWDLWCRFAEAEASFYYLPEPLAAVRLYQGTKTLSGVSKRYREIYRLLRKYSQKSLPTPLMGGLYYDIANKMNKSFWELIFYNFFDLLLKAKQKISHPSLLYGFHRWDSVFEKKCQIHLPWYDKRNWVSLHLKFEPNTARITILLNQSKLEPTSIGNGNMVFDLPKIDSPHRIIQIESGNQNKVKLLDFSIELV